MSNTQLPYREWARTPPRGWNSWDCYGTAVTEAQVKANADFMARHLAPFGWNYVVVDIQWSQPSAEGHAYEEGAKLAMDEWGRLIPATNRFPSGFKALGDYIHELGLKFGIHIMRGIPKNAVAANTPVLGTDRRASDIADPTNTCRWNPDMYGVDTTKPGSQEYYDSLVALYETWGVDFIKADDLGSHLYQPAEIRAIHLAILKAKRPIVLSISPGPASPQEAAFFQRHAQMWRVSDDFWDDWALLKKEFGYALEWEKEIGRDNTWPDADMLPIGRLRMAANGGKGEPSRFTPIEVKTLLSLWSIIRSPLMLGGDLPHLSDSELAMLTNADVLEINESSSGNRSVVIDPDLHCWLAEGPRGQICLGVFNLGETRRKVRLAWTMLGLKAASYTLRELWTGQPLGSKRRFAETIDAHGCALVALTAE